MVKELDEDVSIVCSWLWWPWDKGGVLLFVLWKGGRRQRSIMTIRRAGEETRTPETHALALLLLRIVKRMHNTHTPYLHT